MTRLNRNTSQRAAIKQFLLSGSSITALEALSLFGAYRLAAHINVLRDRDGLLIVTTMNKDVTGRTYARYHCVDVMPLSFHRSVPQGKPTQKEIVYHA